MRGGHTKSGYAWFGGATCSSSYGRRLNHPDYSDRCRREADGRNATSRNAEVAQSVTSSLPSRTSLRIYQHVQGCVSISLKPLSLTLFRHKTPRRRAKYIKTCVTSLSPIFVRRLTRPHASFRLKAGRCIRRACFRNHSDADLGPKQLSVIVRVDCIISRRVWCCCGALLTNHSAAVQTLAISTRHRHRRSQTSPTPP